MYLFRALRQIAPYAVNILFLNRPIFKGLTETASLKKEHAIKIEGGINKKVRDEKGLKNKDRAE